MTTKSPKSTPPRAPAVFEIDTLNEVPAAEPESFSPPTETNSLAPEWDLDPDWELGPAPTKKRFSFLALFISTVGFLASLAGGLWLEKLITDLFARNEYLGMLATGLTGLAILAAIVLIARETIAMRRLKKITHLQETATQDQSLPETIKLVNAVNGLYLNRPDMARARENFKQNSADIFDAPDLLTIAENDLLLILDKRAKRAIGQTARRVAVVTAISPRAVVDLAYVAYESIKLIRTLCVLYGGRPGFLGLMSLTKTALTHLAVTGGVAVGDSLIQQLVGHGLAAKLSTRVGEGFINGLMSVRVGIATVHAVRPLPNAATKPLQVADFITELANFSKDKPVTQAAKTKLKTKK